MDLFIEGFERGWCEADEAKMPRRLSKIRANEGLTKAQVAVGLDVPRKRPEGKKPVGIKVKRTSRAKISLIAEV